MILEMRVLEYWQGFDLAGWLAGPYVFFFFFFTDDAGLLAFL